MEFDPYQIYRSVFESRALRSAWAQAYGDCFWEEAEPPNSQATVDDIAFVMDQLRPDRTSVLADFGCGSGCLGRHVARTTGARVEGIDANPLAVRLAEERAVQAQAATLSFKAGDFAATGWADGRFDGAASLDVLLFLSDKVKGLREIARVLKPGARLAGTTWELRENSRALGVTAFADYPAAFAQAGFDLDVYEETRDWRRNLESALKALAEHESEIRRELHPIAATQVFGWAHNRGTELGDSRRVRFSARRV